MFLELKSYREPVDRKENVKEIAEEWSRKEIKARNYIIRAILNDVLEQVLGETNAYNMLWKLDSLYSKKSNALQIVCRKNLEMLKLNENEDPSKFFVEFDK